MIVLLTTLLTLLAFAFITYPLFKQRAPLADTVEDERSQELRSRRDTTYSMLKEIEFDLQSGILTAEDYQDLESRYKRKAIAILKNLDEVAKTDDVGTEIEKGIAELRRSQGQRPAKASGKKASVADEIEREILELRHSSGPFCPQCGAKRQPSDRFCSKCGTSLR